MDQSPALPIGATIEAETVEACVEQPAILADRVIDLPRQRLRATAMVQALKDEIVAALDLS